VSALYYVLGVLVFSFAIMASIGLHEFGHLVPAKKFGCKVPEWFVGFGPTVWSRRIGETTYGLKAIPLGGYVKIVGMLPPGSEELVEETTYDESGQAVHKIRRSNTGMFTQLISDARAAEWEYVQEHDTERLFYKLAPWKKIVVMAGGPMVNIAIAFSIFAVLFATYGNPNDPDISTVVEDVSQCVIPIADGDRACRADDPVSPAYAAGIQAGDQILNINGVKIEEWEDLQEVIRANDDGQARIELLRDGETMEVTAKTTVELRPTTDGDDSLVQVGYLGVGPEWSFSTGGPLYTLGEMGHMTVNTLEAMLHLPVKVWGVAKAIVGVEERASDSPVSIVGGARFAGETAASETFPFADKTASLFGLVAGFNFFIGMFNFIPLLPLDGGHIAGAAYEWLRRGLAKLFRRPDPGHVDVAKLLPVAYVVGLAMLVMGVVLIVGDLVVPLSITG
jgi:membrane-associated protease RseP (regulator of RpoE activity)